MTINNPNDPTRSPIRRYLEELHARLSKLDTGRVATYIPELARANPAWFGIVIATVDGHVYEVGATATAVHDPVDFEAADLRRGARGPRRRARATGDRRGAERRRVQLDQPRTRHRPAAQPDDQRRRHRDVVARRRAPARKRGSRAWSSMRFRRTRAAPLDIDEAVFESERATGHRNRAIGHMLRNYGIVSEDPEPALELYFKQCSVLDRLPRPRDDRRDAGQRRRQSGDRRARRARRVRRSDPERDDDVRHVRLRRRVGLPRRHAGEERRRRRHRRSAARTTRHRRVLAGARRARQQRARRRGVRSAVATISACTSCIRRGRRYRRCAPATRSRPCARSGAGRRTRARLLDEHGSARRDLRTAGRPALYDGGARWCARSSTAALRSTSRCSISNASRTSMQPATRMLAALTQRCAARRPASGVHARAPRRSARRRSAAELDPRAADAVSFQPQLDLGLEWCERQLLERYAVRRVRCVARRTSGASPLCGRWRRGHRVSRARSSSAASSNPAR